MIATTVSTGIVWSTWYGPRCRVPAPSASTKKVVLSVSISRISWPFLTALSDVHRELYGEAAAGG